MRININSTVIRLRTVVFWLHLGAGVTAGLVIGIMALTGAALALEPQLRDWAEADSRRVAGAGAGAGAALSLEALAARAQAARPGLSATTLTLFAEPHTAVRVGAGKDAVYVARHGGEVRPISGQRLRAVLQTLVTWHRYLGTDGGARPVGKAITGAANAAFLFLALSGLYLWWPRRWTPQARRISLWFRRGLSGKTRDFNWHNVIGFWSLPVLVVITASGMMISYRWATNLVYRVAGEAPPTGGAAPGRPPAVPAPPRGAERLPLALLVDRAAREQPDWKTLTVRLPAASKPGEAPKPVTISVKQQAAWPRFATTQLHLDPFSGEILAREGYEAFGPGRRLRTWLRFLHTGEALGLPGQILAGIVSLAASLLVWTGLALAYRRLFRRSRGGRFSPPPPEAA